MAYRERIFSLTLLIIFSGCLRQLDFNASMFLQTQGCVELLVPTQDFLRAAFNPFSAHPVLVLGIVRIPLHLVSLNFMRYVSCHLSSLSRSLWIACPSSYMFSTWLGVIGKLYKGAFNSTVHVTHTDIKQCGHNINSGGIIPFLLRAKVTLSFLNLCYFSIRIYYIFPKCNLKQLRQY